MSSNYSSALEVFAELLATSYDLVSPPTPAFSAAGEWIRASSAGSECRSEMANLICRPFDPVATAGAANRVMPDCNAIPEQNAGESREFAVRHIRDIG